MHQILIYSDSLTWGIIPDTRARLPFDERWPGVLENKLNASGPRIRVIEDCLNGRRTAWDDQLKRGGNGLRASHNALRSIRHCRSSFSCWEQMIFNSAILTMTLGRRPKA